MATDQVTAAPLDTTVFPGSPWDAHRLALCHAVLPVWSQQLAVTVEHSAKAVSEMLFAFSQLGPVLESLAAHDKPLVPLDSIHAHVEQMYVGFQYQDRLSQALSLLQIDISRMMEALKCEPQSSEALQAAFWLGRLESEYVMAEQHAHAAPHHESANEVTFF